MAWEHFTAPIPKTLRTITRAQNDELWLALAERLAVVNGILPAGAPFLALTDALLCFGAPRCSAIFSGGATSGEPRRLDLLSAILLISPFFTGEFNADASYGEFGWSFDPDPAHAKYLSTWLGLSATPPFLGADLRTPSLVYFNSCRAALQALRAVNFNGKGKYFGDSPCVTGDGGGAADPAGSIEFQEPSDDRPFTFISFPLNFPVRMKRLRLLFSGYDPFGGVYSAVGMNAGFFPADFNFSIPERVTDPSVYVFDFSGDAGTLILRPTFPADHHGAASLGMDRSVIGPLTLDTLAGTWEPDFKYGDDPDPDE